MSDDTKYYYVIRSNKDPSLRPELCEDLLGAWERCREWDRLGRKEVVIVTLVDRDSAVNYEESYKQERDILEREHALFLSEQKLYRDTAKERDQIREQNARMKAVVAAARYSIEKYKENWDSDPPNCECSGCRLERALAALDADKGREEG